MIAWRLLVVSLALAGASTLPAPAQTEVESEWRIVNEPGAMPFELMPRRYVDYPVAYAVWQLAGVAAGCEVTVAAAAESARELGYRVLEAGGFAVGERQAEWQRFVSIVSRQVGPADADTCRAALSAAERAAVSAVPELKAVER